METWLAGDRYQLGLLLDQEHRSLHRTRRSGRLLLPSAQSSLSVTRVSRYHTVSRCQSFSVCSLGLGQHEDLRTSLDHLDDCSWKSHCFVVGTQRDWLESGGDWFCTSSTFVRRLRSRANS